MDTRPLNACDLEAAEGTVADLERLWNALRFSPVWDGPTTGMQTVLDQAVAAWHAGFTLQMDGARPADGEDLRFLLGLLTSLIADAVTIATARVDAVQNALNGQKENA